MKLAIRTLAALLALSSTAAAEDWSTLRTLPENPSKPFCYDIDMYGDDDAYLPHNCALERSRQYTLPSGGLGTEWMGAFQYDSAQNSFGSLPPEIVRSTSSLGTPLAGIPIPNGAVITARCGSTSEVARDFGFLSQILISTTCAPGIIGGSYQIPISAFARSDTVSAMAANVAALEQRILALEAAPVLFEELDAKMQDARRAADEGSAMAAAMTTVAPADGKANRIGFNTATYNGSTAVAVSYSRAAGDVDFNVGVAMAGENAMVKAGAGFSW
jgi:hypothetical protein